MSGQIDMVVTKSISRFARNTLDCLNYIRQLKDKNIPVYFEKEGINTLDAKGEVLLTIMASLAQQESQSLSQNVRLGLQYRY
jgi:DNA invertase Pin-like site-specific DNA recombinase